MGRINANFFISLDGVVESPDEWHFPYFNDEMGAVVGAGLETNVALLMGRALYDEWAAYWPDSTDEPFATHFNDIPKYVVSDSLAHPAWNNTTVLPGDADAVRRLKESTDGDIGMSGSATTVRWLLANGLLDELRLLVHPIVVGHGQRLFEDTHTHKLALTSSSTLSTGVLNLTYAPAS
ncbi:dihydrofolate reductase [Lipingzhangella halophila]|uniref:Dihydrofolate reductase n=1 Tax=Lipingzhangella halophila TaxID=1783352 RepID=A0A7W7W0E6_9ACTN|nr:dihydrofolate reductase family protein [Lipingzhangella halophila]MBB4929832.1 dihydrofolate reductase [Lipingzhangella halophila]